MYFFSISRRFGPAVLSTKEQVEQRDLYRKILEFEQETVRACECLIMKRKGATIEFRPSLDIEPLPHWWEASALTNRPPLLSSYVYLNSNKAFPKA